MSTLPTNIAALFDAAYWASLPTPVQALSSQSLSPTQREALVESLIAQGYSRYLIEAVDDWDWDAYTTLAAASTAGYTWLPSILQLGIGAQGQYSAPGVPPGPGSLGAYPTTPPAGSVVVPPMSELLAPGANVSALIAAWFPPYTPPAPVPPAPTDPVGAQATGSMYLNAPGVNESNWPNGAEFSDSRGTFVHHVIATPFGNESYWSLVALAS